MSRLEGEKKALLVRDGSTEGTDDYEIKTYSDNIVLTSTTQKETGESGKSKPNSELTKNEKYTSLNDFLAKAEAAYDLGTDSNGNNGNDLPKAIRLNGENASSAPDYSVAIGPNSIAVGKSFSFGDNAKAINPWSHAEGYDAYTNGKHSYAKGEQVYANADFSHAEGRGVRTSGKHSFALGNNIIATGDYSIVLGENNKENSGFEYSWRPENIKETISLSNFTPTSDSSRRYWSTTVPAFFAVSVMNFLKKTPLKYKKSVDFIDYIKKFSILCGPAPNAMNLYEKQLFEATYDVNDNSIAFNWIEENSSWVYAESDKAEIILELSAPCGSCYINIGESNFISGSNNTLHSTTNSVVLGSNLISELTMNIYDRDSFLVSQRTWEDIEIINEGSSGAHIAFNPAILSNLPSLEGGYIEDYYALNRLLIILQRGKILGLVRIKRIILGSSPLLVWTDNTQLENLKKALIEASEQYDGEISIILCPIKNYPNNQTILGQYNVPNSDDIFQIGCGTSDSHRKNALSIDKDGKVKRNCPYRSNHDYYKGQLFTENLETPALIYENLYDSGYWLFNIRLEFANAEATGGESNGVRGLLGQIKLGNTIFGENCIYSIQRNRKTTLSFSGMVYISENSNEKIKLYAGSTFWNDTELDSATLRYYIQAYQLF